MTYRYGVILFLFLDHQLTALRGGVRLQGEPLPHCDGHWWAHPACGCYDLMGAEAMPCAEDCISQPSSPSSCSGNPSVHSSATFPDSWSTWQRWAVSSNLFPAHYYIYYICYYSFHLARQWTLWAILPTRQQHRTMVHWWHGYYVGNQLLSDWIWVLLYMKEFISGTINPVRSAWAGIHRLWGRGATTAVFLNRCATKLPSKYLYFYIHGLVLVSALFREASAGGRLQIMQRLIAGHSAGHFSYWL